MRILIRAIRRTPCAIVPTSRAIQIHLSFKFFCTHTAENLSQSNSESPPNPKCLSYRIEKLSRGESVGSAFRTWMGDGFPIHRGDVFHAINRLRKLKMNKRALEVHIPNFSLLFLFLTTRFTVGLYLIVLVLFSFLLSSTRFMLIYWIWD